MKISNNFTAFFFGVPHTIPETTGVLLKTPIGNIVHFADFRLDYDDEGNPHGLEEFERSARWACTPSWWTPPPRKSRAIRSRKKPSRGILRRYSRDAEGRIIVATFSSLITRIAEIIKIAEKLGRKVALNGYSMKTNIQIAQDLGFVKAKEGTIISVEEAHKMKDDKMLILSTGAQGESNAGLMKIINGEHRHIKIKPGDTFVLSSSVIPGNERSVQTVKDNLARQGAIVLPLRARRHPLLRPRAEGRHRARHQAPQTEIPHAGARLLLHARRERQTAREAGVPKENVRLMDNGQVAELTKDRLQGDQGRRARILRDGGRPRRRRRRRGRAPRPPRARRRKACSSSSSPWTATRASSSKIPTSSRAASSISRTTRRSLDEIRKRMRALAQRIPNYREMEPDYVKTLIRDQVGQFIYKKTRRRPMILPVIIEI